MKKLNKAPKSDKLANSIELANAEQGLTIGPVQEMAIEPVKAAVTPDGYAHFIAKDRDGTVFVTCQPASREYLTAVMADSPLGRIVVRWSRDDKAQRRMAKKIDAGTWSTPGLSNSHVADVTVSPSAPQLATVATRRREVDYYAPLGMSGPHAEARAIARAIKAELAAQAVTAAPIE